MTGFPSGLRQPEASMRFALDALLLPCFVRECLILHTARPKNPLRDQAIVPGTRGLLSAADCGCGCGASSLALGLLVPEVKVWGVDREPELISCAKENAASVQLKERVVFSCLDLARLATAQGLAACLGSPRPFCDMVQMNPPYWEEGRGHASARPLNEAARRGSNALSLFLAAAKTLLVHHGRLFLIWPARDISACVCALAAAGFGLRTLCCVRPELTRPAVRVLCEAWKGAAAESVLLPDIVLYEEGSTGQRVVTARAQAFCPWLH